jgi:predicted RNA-binding protein with PIN domain
VTRPLPAAVRTRVLALAADRLSSLSEEQVPPAVRPFRRFTPKRRAAAAAVPLAAVLEQDPVFRQLVSEAVPAPLAEALRSGVSPSAAPPDEVAAAAYLLRTEGWEAVVEAAAAELAARDRVAAGAATVDEVQRLTEQLEALRAHGRLEAGRLSRERDVARAEAVAAVRRSRELGARAAAAERALAAAAAGPAEQTPAAEPVRDDGVELRRLRAKLRTAEEALAACRAAARGERREEQVRLPPVEERPADTLAEALAAATPPSSASVAVQGRSDDDPALLDALLAVPSTHLLVDGYNVTKSGYGEQSLEVQRGRLLTALGALAARTGVELTVVFDGAGLEAGRPAAAPAPRGVRLLFSRAGETADDVLRALVRREPRGRPVVVVSSDREVADDVRRDGARPVASRALLGLLERGAR